MDEVIISVKNAKLSFGEYSLGPVNLDIPKGYIIGVQGENGAGKSTFIKMLMGSYKNMKGEIILDGENVLSSREFTFQRVGYISDKRCFFEEENVFCNELYYSDYYSNWDGSVYRKLIEQFKLPQVTKLGNFSKGERVKFQLAFSMAYNPKVLLLDEPTAGLDPVFRDDFLRILQELIAGYETTILLATHLDEDLKNIADYKIDIHNGRVVMNEII